MNTMDTDKDSKIRAEIRAAAREVFQKWGIEKTSMEDIAKAARKGKSTLYTYYKSKEDVLFDVSQEEIGHLFAITQAAVTAAKTAKEQIIAFISVRAAEIRKQVAVYPIMIGDLRNSGWFFRIRKLFDGEEVRLIRNILETGVRNGEFRLFNELEIESYAYIIVNTIRSMEIDLIMGEDHLREMDMVELAADLVVNGLRR